MKKNVVGLKQFLLFCVVGGINTVFDISLYLLFHQILGVVVYIASPITVLLVMSLSYIMNSKLVFSYKLDKKKYVEFLLLTGLGVLIIQTLISLIFESHTQSVIKSLTPEVNQDTQIFIANSITRISGIVFSLSWNFLFYKFVVFKYVDKKEANEPVPETLLKSME